MRLSGLYIDGFGVFSQVRVEALPPGITVFLGENESGKSTMLGFIRTVLFGFPDGRSNENHYPPLAGGKHGGSIEIVDNKNQLYIVERSPGPRGGRVEVVRPDQTHEGPEFLDRILGITSRTLFNNIYAFSLSELQNFETLNTESVRETLYSAGAGVNPKRLADLKIITEKRENDLFKPGGNRPEINRILSRLYAIRKEKKGIQGSVEEYDLMKSEITRLGRDIQTFEQKKLECLKGIREKERWITVFPEWINLVISREKLAKLDPVDLFPAQGVFRLEGLYSRLDDLKKGLVKAEQEYKRQKNELSVLKTDPRILDFSGSVRALQKGEAHFDAVLKDMLLLEQELASGKTRLNEGMTRLGPSWDEDVIMGFDLSVSVREEVRLYRETLNQAGMEVNRKADILEGLASRKREQEAVLKNMQVPAVEDVEQLNKTRRSIRELKAVKSDARLINEELRQFEARLKDLKEERSALDEDIMEKTVLPPIWLVIGIIFSGMILLAWFGLKGQWSTGFYVMVLSLITGIAVWFVRAVSGRAGQRRFSHLARRLDLIGSKIADIEGYKEKIRTDSDQLSERAELIRSELSVSDTISMDMLESMEHENLEDIMRLERWKESAESLKQCDKGLDYALAELENAEAKRVRIKTEWTEWLKDRRLNEALTPDGVLETLTVIQSCREQINSLNSLRERLTLIRNSRDEYLSLANDVLGSFGYVANKDTDIQVAVNDLIRNYKEAEQAEQKRAIIEREMTTSLDMVEQFRVQISDLYKEINDLMAQGGAEDEDQFRSRSQVYEARLELLREAETIESNIRKLSTDLGDFSEVLKALPDIRFEGLKDDKQRLDMELKDMEEGLDKMKKEEARLEERIRSLVDDEHISMLRSEEEGLKESLGLLADEWLINRLAQILVKNARSRYEKERQPGVIAESGRFFKEMTLGRYPAVASPIGENRIEVVGRDNKRKDISFLSRGTAEQLYLSLRFGFVKEFSKRSTQLPVIMDEILVNFDRKRAQATVRGIMELANEHQILYFTCHPETAGLFQEADPGVNVLEISRGEVRACGIVER